VIDRVDATLAPEIEALGLRVVVTDTIISDDAARARLAGEMLQAAGA
jgi:LPPG:FO 2-phospho-L-lactate transferase